MNKQERQEEKQKLKTMTWKERIDYILTYYHVPIIIAIVVILIIGVAIGAVVRSFQDTMLYCAFVNEQKVTEAQTGLLYDEFYAREGFSGWKQTLSFDVAMDLEDMSVKEASMVKFQSLIGTETIDVMITTEAIGESYQTHTIFVDLRDVLPEDTYTAVEDRLFWGTNLAGERVPMGIYLEGSALDQKLMLEEDSILTVCTLKNHPDVIVDFVEYAFDLE